MHKESIFSEKNRCNNSFYSNNVSVMEHIHSLAEAKNMEKVCKIALSIGKQYGFELFNAIAHINRPDTPSISLEITQCNNEYLLKHENIQHQFTDPGISLSNSTAIPYTLSYPFIDINHSTKHHNIASKNSTSNLCDIFHAPFHTANGGYGVIRFIRYNHQKNTHTCQLNDNKKADISTLSSHIYSSIIRLAPHSKNNVKNIVSSREKEILEWVCQGKSPILISDILNISENTVKNHLKSIRKKLEVKNITHAAVKAISLGIITL